MNHTFTRHRQPSALAVAFACYALLFSSVPGVAAQSKRAHPSAQEILRRSIDRGRSVNFRGIESVIIQRPHASMVRMTRQVTYSRDGVSLTKWTSPRERTGMTVLDDGAWSRSFHPKEDAVRVSRSIPKARDAASAEKLQRLILRNYRIKLEGVEPMANRSCYKLRLTPNNPISLVVEMWIDRKTGTVLGHTESTPRGDTLSVTRFDGIEYPSTIQAAKLRKAFPKRRLEEKFSRSEILRDFDEVRKRVGFEFCAPYSMPAGFEFQYAEVLSIKGITTTCLRYSDGLSEITICQNRAEEQRPAEYQAIQPMADPLGNNVVDFRNGQMNFYLVGRCHMSGLIAVTKALDLNKERLYLEFFTRNYNIPMKTLVSLRNQGLGLDTLDALLAINRKVKQPLASLAALTRQGHGWMAVARRFQVDVRAIANHVRTFECR